MIRILALLLAQQASAHTRLECPPPRSKQTGAKQGPCDAPDNLNLKPYPLHPGLNTVTWLESLGHPGAPGRFALSLDGSDTGFESCILLDHVPHDENSNPSMADERMYHRSSITLWIPDVQCERCNLQLITYMTDGMHGLPKGDSCVSPQAKVEGKVESTLPDCKVIYHSCAPVSINGTVPRADHTCDLAEHNAQLGWPFMEGKPPMSTYLYKGDPGLYSKDKSRLVSAGSPVAGCNSPFFCDPEIYYAKTFDVPSDAKYASLQGTCAAVVDMEVVPFVLGKVSTTLKTVTLEAETDVSLEAETDVSLETPGKPALSASGWKAPAMASVTTAVVAVALLFTSI